MLIEAAVWAIGSLFILWYAARDSRKEKWQIAGNDYDWISMTLLAFIWPIALPLFLCMAVPVCIVAGVSEGFRWLANVELF